MTNSAGSRAYPAGTEWTFRNPESGTERTTALELSWEVTGDPITDDYLPGEITARELWDLWYPQYAKDGTARIYWSIRGDKIAESAPFQVGWGEEQINFLSSGCFTWPAHAKTGEPLNWLRLPVRDKLWHGQRGDKGGFIQELLGWKPSPYEPVFHADALARAAGLT